MQPPSLGMDLEAAGESWGEGEGTFESTLTHAAERMDPAEVVRQVRDAWRSLPPDVKQEIQRRALSIWRLRGEYFGRFLASLNALIAENPTRWQQALLQDRAGAAHRLALLAGRAAGLPPREAGYPRGLGDIQVRQFHRRQQGRGYVPGRSRQTGLYRELEDELQSAAHELEGPEPFFTKVTPIPGIGNKEGHEILTKNAMKGLPLSSDDQSAILDGVIRPDRGGKSYWNFPRAALEALKAKAQPSHALRPTPSSSVATALHLIRLRFVRLYLQAMRAPSRKLAMEWLGEALHLLQDSFSSAHVDRVGGTGLIRNIRAFYIRIGRPPLSRAPGEHNAPSDPRDDVYLRGKLRPEALAAIRVSRNFLRMALRHLRAPRAPGNLKELRLFMGR
jgi:hypothetical protein